MCSLEKDFISTYSSESPVYAYAGSLAVASTATRFASSVACFHTLLSILYLVNRVMLVSASDIVAPIDLNQHRQHSIRSLNLWIRQCTIMQYQQNSSICEQYSHSGFVTLTCRKSSWALWFRPKPEPEPKPQLTPARMREVRWRQFFSVSLHLEAMDLTNTGGRSTGFALCGVNLGSLDSTKKQSLVVGSGATKRNHRENVRKQRCKDARHGSNSRF